MPTQRRRPVRPYSEAFKSKMVQRMTGPNAATATQLAQQVGVPQPTLSKWLREAVDHATLSDAVPSAPKDLSGPARSAEDKLRLVLAAERLQDEDLGALLRREGIHSAELAAWRATVVDAAVAALHGPAGELATTRAEGKRLRELERELRRKDKALAEAAALLVLQKKARQLWGDGDDGTDEGSGR